MESNMTDLTQTPPRLPQLWKRLDKALLLTGLVLLAVAIFDPANLFPTFKFTPGRPMESGALPLVCHPRHRLCASHGRRDPVEQGV